MATKKLEAADRRLLSKHFDNYGTITEAVEKTTISRSTITRVIATGKASAHIVDRLVKYVKTGE